MDLYPITLAIYAFLFTVSLIYFKFTIKEITIAEYRETKQKIKINFSKNDRVQQCNVDNERKGNVGHGFKFLIRNFTIAQIFINKVSRRVLVLLFGYAAIGVFLFFIGFSEYWPLAFLLNAVISLIIIAVEYREEKKVIKTKQINLKQWKYSKVIHSIIGILTLGLYLFLFKLCYKNYKNTILNKMLISLATVFLTDNFAIKPFFFFIIAYLTKQNTAMISLITKYQKQQQKHIARVANLNKTQPPPSSQHEKDRNQNVIELKVKPYSRIDLIKVSKQIIHNNVLLTNINLMDTISNYHQTSAQNIFNYQEKKIETHNDLFQYEQAEEHPNIQLKKYCINMRKQPLNNNHHHIAINQYHLSKSLQNKNKTEDIYHHQPHLNQKQLSINRDKEKDKERDRDRDRDRDDIHNSKSSNRSKRISQIKSKDSLRGVNSMRIIDHTKDINFQTIENINYKQNLNIQIACKDQIIPPYAHAHVNKDNSCTSKGKTQHNRHALKINQYNQYLQDENKDLQQINLEQTPHQRTHNHNFYQTHIIPEEQLKQRHRRQRRRAVKPQVNLPLNDKLIAIYHPQSTKSQRDSLFRAIKKQTFNKSQLVNHSRRKSQSIGRDKPIVHMIDKENQVTEFYLPRFNQNS